jgi:type IV pilus assembly protein PilB
MPGRWGEKILIRIVDPEKAAVTLEKLGFAYDTLKQWRKLITLPNGLLLVTGPAGSGKRSTLYASLQELNRPDVNICTIEAPVVYALSGINQFQVNDIAGFTSAAALRSLLHQRPDVVMVAQVGDPDTARTCTQAALTDHLLLTTLHAPDAPSAVTRLMNFGVEPYLVGASLAGVLAQRLVRKLCTACKEPSAPTLTEKRHLEKFGGAVETLFRPVGCPACHKTGYRGRIGLHELLVIEETLAERISQAAPLSEIRQIARNLGIRTLRADGVDKVKAGITTLEEVHRVTA